MKKEFKIFLIHFLIMSIYIWGVWIYGAVKNEFNPVGEGIGILFLTIIQTIITFLICLYSLFKTQGEIASFKTLGLNILSIIISFIIYLCVDHYWMRIHTFFSKT